MTVQQMAAGVLGLHLVHAVPTAIKSDNVSAAPVIRATTALERIRMECKWTKSSAMSKSVMLPSMVTGAAGHHGVCVTLNVDLESKPERGLVTTPRQGIKANRALEVQRARKCAS